MEIEEFYCFFLSSINMYNSFGVSKQLVRFDLDNEYDFQNISLFLLVTFLGEHF